MSYILTKNGKGCKIIEGMFVSKTVNNVSLLISDDEQKIYNFLEQHQGVIIAFGEYFNHTIKTKSHYIESSIVSGGGQKALREGQIIVYFEKL